MKIAYGILIVVLIAGCLRRPQAPVSVHQPLLESMQDLEKPAPKPCNVTIWIHGTRLLPRALFKRFFFAIPGLVCMDELKNKCQLKTIAQALNSADEQQFPRAFLYQFGWSGELCVNARLQAARELHAALVALIERLREQNYCPTITIITHSHGGNVALNLAKIAGECTQQITIDRLILLACPVQKETKMLVAHSIFKKIYSLYSTLDIVQIADPQALHRSKNHDQAPPRTSFFSERQFPACDSLQQVKVKMNGRGLFHVEFVLAPFLRALPLILDEIDRVCPRLVHVTADNTEIVRVKGIRHNARRRAR